MLAELYCFQSILHKSIRKTVLIRNRKWSETRDPDNFSCFSTQKWCAWELPEIALKQAMANGGLLVVEQI